MDNLYQRHCEICHLGTPVLTEDEASSLALAIPSWRREFHDGVEKLIREFHFIEFNDAFSFTYKISKLAEHENHHPSILTEWGKVTVYWWTHKINGLHSNDFIMAAKADLIAKSVRSNSADT